VDLRESIAMPLIQIEQSRLPSAELRENAAHHYSATDES
jgi:hypothetical protein